MKIWGWVPLVSNFGVGMSITRINFGMGMQFIWDLGWEKLMKKNNNNNKGKMVFCPIFLSYFLPTKQKFSYQLIFFSSVNQTHRGKIFFILFHSFHFHSFPFLPFLRSKRDLIVIRVKLCTTSWNIFFKYVQYFKIICGAFRILKYFSSDT